MEMNSTKNMEDDRKAGSEDLNRFVYTCNICSKPIESRYHCLKCDDFNLCIPCFEKEGHPHRMEKIIDENKRLAIERCIRSLVHACLCKDTDCKLPSCHKMKRVVTHTKQCKRKSNGGCPICKQVIALCCYHAKMCQEAKCPVPYCRSIKQKLKQQQLKQRLEEQALMRKRINETNLGIEKNSGMNLYIFVVINFIYLYRFDFLYKVTIWQF